MFSKDKKNSKNDSRGVQTTKNLPENWPQTSNSNQNTGLLPVASGLDHIPFPLNRQPYFRAKIL